MNCRDSKAPNMFFDIKNWGFRQGRGGRIFSHPTKFWSDAQTTICKDELTSREVCDLIPVPDVSKFPIAYQHDMTFDGLPWFSWKCHDRTTSLEAWARSQLGTKEVIQPPRFAFKGSAEPADYRFYLRHSNGCIHLMADSTKSNATYYVATVNPDHCGAPTITAWGEIGFKTEAK